MDKKEILFKSINDAKEWIKLSKDPAHDIEHIKSVTETALEICKKINYKDTLLIQTICIWHDVGRLFSPIHEKLSAHIAKNNLLGYGCDKDTANMVYQGIRFHKWKMKPKTLEGNILRDADKLDFISIPRWKKCIKKNHTQHLFPIIKLLPKLRKILKLDVSKQIYDLRIKKFIDYTKTDKDLRNSILFDSFPKH